MAGKGASNDPLWIENELFMLEKTLGMYQTYAASAPNKDAKKNWADKIHHMEEHITEVKHRLEIARKRAGISGVPL